MDPLSVTTAILAFVDAATKIKESVDKVAQNRRRLCNLSDDILRDLNALHNFCSAHKLALKDATELKDSLDELKSQLFRVSSKCQRLFDNQPKGKLGKLKAGYLSWRNAGDIEAEVIRLRENVQSSVNRIQLYVSARTEITLAQTAHNVLLLKSDVRSHINRFDTLFGQSICQPGSRDFASVLGYSEPDDADRQYLHFKLQSIADTLEMWTFSIVDPGPYRFINNRYIRSNLPKETMTIIESTLAPAWRTIHLVNDIPTTSFFSRCLDPLLDLACDVMYRGFDNIVYRIFDFGARILRQLIQTDDDDELLFYLSWVLVQQHYTCRPGPQQVAIAQEMVNIRRKLFQSSKATYARSLRLFWLHHSLVRLAYTQYCTENAEEAVFHYQEALQLTHSTEQRDYAEYIPITCQLSGEYTFAFQPSRTFVQDFSMAQSTAYALSLYTGSLRVLGRYSEAHFAGRDSITIIQTLQARASDLPRDFNFLGHRLQWLQSNISSWVEIIRNPTTQASGFIEDVPDEGEYVDEGSESSSQCVEWGVAI